MEGKLEVQLDELLINKYNVENLLDEFSKSIKTISPEFIKFCVKARSKETKNKIKYKLKRNLTKRTYRW